MNFDVVKVEKEGSIFTLTLNRPGHLNSTSIDMLEQMTGAFRVPVIISNADLRRREDIIRVKVNNRRKVG